MNRNARLLLALLFAAIVAGATWATLGKDPETPNAPAPRGAYATDRASDEPKP